MLESAFLPCKHRSKDELESHRMASMWSIQFAAKPLPRYYADVKLNGYFTHEIYKILVLSSGCINFRAVYHEIQSYSRGAAAEFVWLYPVEIIWESNSPRFSPKELSQWFWLGKQISNAKVVSGGW